jgi:hypothetical protein
VGADFCFISKIEKSNCRYGKMTPVLTGERGRGTSEIIGSLSNGRFQESRSYECSTSRESTFGGPESP